MAENIYVALIESDDENELSKALKGEEAHANTMIYVIEDSKLRVALAALASASRLTEKG